MNIRRLRWRIGRKVIGEPIVSDPLQGKGDGAYVVTRSKGISVSFTLDEFEMESTVNLKPRMYGGTDLTYTSHPRQVLTFTGSSGKGNPE